MYKNQSTDMIAWLKVIFLSTLLIVVMREFIVEPVEVHGQSMQPTFEEADLVMISKLTSIENFDLIVFKVPNGDNYIKRVIGIPGDRVEVKDDELYLNGQVVEEPYLQSNRAKAHAMGYRGLMADVAALTVPSGCYFVLGDNRAHSLDSRKIGFISEKDVIGEVKLRLSPVKEIGVVR